MALPKLKLASVRADSFACGDDHGGHWHHGAPTAPSGSGSVQYQCSCDSCLPTGRVSRRDVYPGYADHSPRTHAFRTREKHLELGPGFIYV